MAAKPEIAASDRRPTTSAGRRTHRAFSDLEEEQAGATDWVKANAKFMEATFVEQGANFKKADPWNSFAVTADVGETKLISAQNPQSALAGAKACLEVLA